MKVVLFSKTLWNEPPRLRHQVARMLAKRGHEVIFVEKCSFLGPRRSGSAGAIGLLRHGELLHHQLRPFRGLVRLNAAYEKAQIRQLLSPAQDPIVINFCYDYYFLRDIFPRSVIVTIINDDVIDAAKWFMKREARRVLAATARISDENLVVSYPLREELSKLCGRVSVFLPWARRRYVRPVGLGRREEILYWGYINDRVDWRVVRQILDAGVRINFVGPLSASRMATSVLAHRNAAYHGVADLGQIPDVVASCACSILPYNVGYRMVAATTISNRAFDLLSCGLALLYCSLPGLLEAPSEVIYVCKTASDYIRGWQLAKECFAACQDSIERFLEGHYEEERYGQLLRTIQGTSGAMRCCG